MKAPALLEETPFHKLSNRFSLQKIRQALLSASVRAEVLCRRCTPWPNPLDTKEYINRYEFRPGRPVVLREGRSAFSVLEFLFNSVDLTFVRHLAAPYYRMRNWQAIHDPVILYQIQLWLTAEDLFFEEAIDILRDKKRGREARELLNLPRDEVPKTYTVLTRNLERLGDEGLWTIDEVYFQILVEAGFVTGPVHLACDSQLAATFSRFHRCNGFESSCGELTVTRKQIAGALEVTLERIEAEWQAHRLEPPEAHRHLVSLPCPRGITVEKGKCPLDVRLGWLRLFDKRRSPRKADEATDWPTKSQFLRAHYLGFELEAWLPEAVSTDSFRLGCPRLPSDPTARVGWKNSNQPTGHPVPVFGADLEEITFRVPEFGLELPFGVLGAPGNAPTRLAALLSILDETGEKVRPISGALDAHYDVLENYRLLRSLGIIPLIDLVHHANEVSPEATLKRGITLDGRPLARCGVPMRSNGYDASTQRRSFHCARQCGPDTCRACPYGGLPYSSLGQTAKASIHQFPRYVIELQRGGADYNKLFDGRSAAERTHADVDLLAPKALVRPRLRKVRKISAKAAIAYHLLLWQRTYTFISDVNHLDQVAGLYQCAVDDAVLVTGVHTLHQMKPEWVEGLKPEHFG